jgi:hypothetical protein
MTPASLAVGCMLSIVSAQTLANAHLHYIANDTSHISYRETNNDKKPYLVLTNKQRRRAHLRRIKPVVIKPVRTADMASPGNDASGVSTASQKSIIPSTDSKASVSSPGKKPNNNAYFKFTFNSQAFPLSSMNFFPAVKLNYGYKDEPSNLRTYRDSARLDPRGSATGLSGGMEIGSRKGIFVGMSFGGLVNSYRSGYAAAQIGYNLKLTNRFTLQPSITYSGLTLITSLGNIPMNGRDIVAEGKVYPWVTCSCGKSTIVQAESRNTLKFLQYKLALSYHVSNYVAFRFGAYVWTQLATTSDLRLFNKSTEHTFHNKVYTAQGGSQVDLNTTSANALYWEASFLFTFKTPPPSPNASGSKHHYHSTYHHIGSFHHCH